MHFSNDVCFRVPQMKMPISAKRINIVTENSRSEKLVAERGKIPLKAGTPKVCPCFHMSNMI
jgi:hypothetical protein